MAPIKERRLQIRIDQERKRLLQRAADATDQSVSSFVLGAASQHAETILFERPLIELAPQAAQAFSEALARPAGVNERLAAALERERRFHWVD